MKFFSGSLPFVFIMAICLTAQLPMENSNPTREKVPMKVVSDEPNLLEVLMTREPALFDSILKNRDKFRVELILTQIDRDKKNRPTFRTYHYNPAPSRYFYPASTVKFPIAILALQKLRELKIAGLDMNSTMITGENGDGQTAVNSDPTAPGGKPSIAHYIKKILLVSDNDAFNRLYEFLGQDYINSTLQGMGYKQTEIIHRLSISLSPEQNRHTNPIKFYDPGGKLLYEQPAVKSTRMFITRDTSGGGYRMGKGFIRGEQLVHEPFDFAMKNQFPLADFHEITRSIIFPGSMPRGKRFNLETEDYNFLRKFMSMHPPESVSPVYDASYGDTHVKMLYYGTEKIPAEPGIRIFNKTGTAYGFLTESCYFTDHINKVEFLLSAVIYCNSDGIFNDDKYDYAVLGYPFLKNIGRVVYAHEKQRQRKYLPDLSAFRFAYRD